MDSKIVDLKVRFEIVNKPDFIQEVTDDLIEYIMDYSAFGSVDVEIETEVREKDDGQSA